MTVIDQSELDRMLDMAFAAMERAYAPYSHFKVGACLRTDEGKYYMGCNVENAAYTPTNCAERTALFHAIYEGERKFSGIAIACSGQKPAYPCGVCRQALSEFCPPEMPVYCANSRRETALLSLGELLPCTFGPKDLL